MFDGKIARTKKDRTEEEKMFGVQIDSLCDVVCFGILPAMISYCLGMDGIFGKCMIVYYGFCSVIRLAYFNVLEAKRQKTEDGATKYYHGLPITSMAIALPIVYLIGFLIPAPVFKVLLFFNMLIVGTLFIVDFPLKKPSAKSTCIVAAAACCALFAILIFTKVNLIHLPAGRELILSNRMK